MWVYPTTIILYVNGIEEARTNFTGTIDYTGTNFAVGNFNGAIDDVRLYSRVLNASAEISDLAAGKHTTSTWNASSAGDYDNANNWIPVAVPDLYTIVIISGSTASVTSSTDQEMASLDIGPGATFDIGANSFLLNDSGIFSNYGTLVILNSTNQAFTTFTNDTDSGTVRINGVDATTGFATGNSYYNLILAGTATYTLASDLMVNGSLTLENGGLDGSMNGRTIIVKKDWQKGAGYFSPGNSTVHLYGIGQSITGSNTFYNLQKSVSTADTLTFQADSLQTIRNNLQLQGAGSASQFLSLRSSTDGTQWKIDPQGNRDVSGLDIKDSNNVNSSPIVLTGLNKNSGNNLNWTFNTTLPSVSLDSVDSPTTSTRPTISGTAKESNVPIVAVSFQVDGTSGSWLPCTAKDGGFNSPSEDFSCKPTTGLSDDTHTAYVRATDANDNSSSSSSYASVSFRVDTEAPDISSVSADPSSTSVEIKWDTDEYSSSRVEYGTSSSYGKKTSEEDTSSGVKSHKVSISDLSSCTEYHYQAESTDRAGNKTSSSDKTFTTTGCSSSSDDSSSSSSNDTFSSSNDSTATTDTTPADQTTTSTDTSNSGSSVLPNTAAPAPIKVNYNGTTSEDWQVKYFGSALCYDSGKCAASSDPDGDGVPNSEEYRLGTDPLKADSDGDGVNDATELESGRNPTVSGTSQGNDAITYENAKDSGEVKKETYLVKNVEMVEEEGTKKLKVSGKGPPNTFVTVFIYSDPIVLTIKTDSEGNWSYVLEQDIEDGQHEVYVAVTDTAGKISEKSEPLAFVKTAEAVTVIPPAEAAAAQRAESPTQVWYKNGLFYFVAIVLAALALALGSIGLWKHRLSKKAEVAPSPTIQAGS